MTNRRALTRAEVVGAVLAIMIIFVVLFHPVLLGMLSSNWSHGYQGNTCRNNFKNIDLIMRMYASDYSPCSSFRALFDTQIAMEPRLFICATSDKEPGEISKIEEWSDYVLIPEGRATKSGHVVVVYCKKHSFEKTGKTVMLCADGQVRRGPLDLQDGYDKEKR